jgi:hypothetical protein
MVGNGSIPYHTNNLCLIHLGFLYLQTKGQQIKLPLLLPYVVWSVAGK